LYGDSSNVLDGAFNAATTNYDITVPNGKTQVRLTAATPASSKAAVVIKYGGTATFGAPDDTDYTVGNPINLPAKGDTILVIKIRVTAENSQHQTYRITFSNPTQVFTWQGTVTLEGNAASTYTVKSVEVKTTNGMHFSSGNVSTEANNWSVQISETYATAANPPDIFTVILQTSAQKIYRTAFLTTDLGGAEPAVDIALTVEDAAAAGIALEVHDPLDLATMLPTENYYLADDIDLTELDGAWNGPDNYGETFDGNGHTIRLQLSNTTGPVGLFDSLASNAVIKNFTVEVSTSEALKDSLTIDYLYFGSVIGMVSSGTTNLKIQNIKATGRLEFFRHSGDKWITIGGFIGGINEANTSSYSQDHIYIGGFLGKQWRADHALTIENSAALNPRVVARVAANHTSYAHYGRMLSVIPNGHTVTLTNNHGLDAMPIGVVTTADDAPATTIDGADAAANNKEGENQTEATLHTAAFWTDTAGWSTSIWDFTDILTAWPTLK
jgi:hypothetical protein